MYSYHVFTFPTANRKTYGFILLFRLVDIIQATHKVGERVIISMTKPKNFTVTSTGVVIFISLKIVGNLNFTLFIF